MKMWKKTFVWSFGNTLVAWRHKNTGRYFSRLFSNWLLGAFVFGILTSILFLALDLPQLSLPVARTVFFIYLVYGVITDFFRYIIYGLNYQVCENALVFTRPLLGWEAAGNKIFSTKKKPLTRYYYLSWKDVTDIKDSEDSLLLTIQTKKHNVELTVPVTPVLHASMFLDNKETTKNFADNSKTDKQKTEFNKQIFKTVLQTARSAQKNFQQE